LIISSSLDETSSQCNDSRYHAYGAGNKGLQLMAENKGGARVAALVEELAGAAERAGMQVRRERLLREVGYRARGGACRFREKDLVIIDSAQSPAEQLEVLIEALRTRDLEAIYLSPAARRLLQDEVRQKAGAAGTRAEVNHG